MKYFLILMILSTNTYARKCQQSIDQYEKWNEKFSSLIEFKIEHETNDTYYVSVKLPEEINKEELTSVQLNLIRNKKELLLSSELVIYKKNEGSIAYYQVSKGLKSHGHIVVQYGEYFCGIVVSKKLRVNDKKT